MGFTPETIEAVWRKATKVENNDPAIFRKDTCSAWICRTHYGSRDSAYGWEIDHVNPKGGDDLSNLAPLHWQNNAAKGDGALRCVVTSSGVENVTSVGR